MFGPLWYDYIFGEYPIPDHFLSEPKEEKKPETLEQKVEVGATPSENFPPKIYETKSDDYYGVESQRKYVLDEKGNLKERK